MNTEKRIEYKIELIGCDDTTEINIHLSEEERNILKIIEIISKRKGGGCKPVLKITGIKINDLERVCALEHYALGISKVKVIFRNKETGEEKAYWMDRKTYTAISLTEIATIENYKQYGEVVEARNCDIYDIEEQN